MKRHVLIFGFIIFCSIFMIVILPGCNEKATAPGAANSSPPETGTISSTRVTPLPGDTVQGVSAQLPPYNLDEIIMASDAIALGKVIEILPGKEGFDPLFGKRPGIYTDVIVEVERYLYGEPQLKNVAIRASGGRIGKHVEIVDNEAEFDLGENVLVFLFRPAFEMSPPEGIDPRGYYRTTILMQGKYTYHDGIATSKIGIIGDLKLDYVANKVASLRNVPAK